MGEIDPGTATNSSAGCVMLALGSDVPRAGRMTLIDLWRLQSMARWSWTVKEEPALAKAYRHDGAEVPTQP